MRLWLESTSNEAADLMRFVANLKTFRINRNAYISAINQRFAQLIQEAAQRWLRAVLMSPLGRGPIPVWSGASAATFTELAAAVAYPLGISPDGNAPNRITFGTQHGRGALATDPGRRFTFQYETDLRHLIYNEFNNANEVGFKLRHPGPYQFQERGRAAFEEFARHARMPDPFDHLIIRQNQI